MQIDLHEHIKQLKIKELCFGRLSGSSFLFLKCDKCFVREACSLDKATYKKEGHPFPDRPTCHEEYDPHRLIIVKKIAELSKEGWCVEEPKKLDCRGKHWQ